jgi:pyridoxal phosphate phosphatase PHOSPHO2
MTTHCKHLVAFDFDHTIIDENSDLYVRKLAPNGEIPPHIHDLYDNQGWTKYMAAIFEYLHANGTTSEEILNCMAELEFTAGMEELLSFLENDTFDVIIISDANSVFIKHIMKCAGWDGVVDQVYSNPAHFNEAGLLELRGFHHQDWCELSTRNLCKGHILQEHIRKQAAQNVTYSTVAYVGDGSNDLCPGLKLTSRDILFPREGFSLAEKIPQYENELQAKVIMWKNGGDILQELKKL